MIECRECFSHSKPATFSSLEELEIHLTNDHFKLNIYECGYCPYAKFPTEGTLVDHFNTIHKITSNIQIKYTLDPSSIEIRRHIRHILDCSASHVKQEAGTQLNTAVLSFSSESNQSSDLIVDETNDNEQDDEVIWLEQEEPHTDVKLEEADLIQEAKSAISSLSGVGAIGHVAPVNSRCPQILEFDLQSTCQTSSSPYNDSTASSTTWDLPAPTVLPPPVRVEVAGFTSTVCSRQTKLNFTPVPSARAVNRRIQEQIEQAGHATTSKLISCMDERTPVKSNDFEPKIKKSPRGRTRSFSISSPSVEDNRWLALGNTPDHRRISDRRSVQPDHFYAGPAKGHRKRKTDTTSPVTIKRKRGRPKGSKVNKPTVVNSSTTTADQRSLVATAKKSRKVKLSRDRGLPPRPISAFLHFTNDYRDIIKTKSLAQGVSRRVLAKQLWEGLENKDYWKAKEKEDSIRYKSAQLAGKEKEVSGNV